VSAAPVAGYSGKPLAAKLGIKSGFRIAALHSPMDYVSLVAPMPPDVTVSDSTGGDPFDLIHLFVTEATTLTVKLPPLKARIVPNGMIWVSWPKKASGVATDVTEDMIRDTALANGLVDVKVCAVDSVWSGLKLVIPVQERPPAARK
jgi:hypothetical protein